METINPVRKFCASHGYKPEIDRLEVIKETDKTIYFIRKSGAKDMQRKESAYYSWHDTKGEAKVEIITRIQREIDRLERSIQQLKAKIEQAKSL